MTIGENIKRIRKEKGMTQKQLGDLCGMNEANVRKYELGKANPKIETICKIAFALGVSEYELQGISTQDILDSLNERTSFYNYLHSMGYDIHESPYNDKWIISIKESNTDIYISDEEMDTLERTTKENIDLRITKYMSDGKHNQ